MPPKPKVPKKTAADRAREAEELHQAQLEEARVAAAKLKREKEAREAEDAAILKVQVEARRIEMSGERDDCRERTMVNRNVMRRKRDEQEQELQWQQYSSGTPNNASLLQSWENQEYDFTESIQEVIDSVFDRLESAHAMALRLFALKCEACDTMDANAAQTINSQQERVRTLTHSLLTMMTKAVICYPDLLSPESPLAYTKINQSYTYAMFETINKKLLSPQFTLEFTEELPQNKFVQLTHILDASLIEHPLRIDRNNSSVIGGILHIDLIEQPTKPRTVNNWQMREADPDIILSTESAFPYTVQYLETALSGAFLCEDGIAVMWHNGSEWVSHDIGDIEFDVEGGKVKFSSRHFAPHAIVKRPLDLPLKSWSLSPDPDNKAINLRMETKSTNINIEVQITEKGCTLIHPKSESREGKLNGHHQSTFLIEILRSYGLFLTAPTTLQNIEFETLKHPTAEESLIESLVIAALHCNINSDETNHRLGHSDFTLRLQMPETPETHHPRIPIVYRYIREAEGILQYAGVLRGVEFEGMVNRIQLNLDEYQLHGTIYHLLSDFTKLSIPLDSDTGPTCPFLLRIFCKEHHHNEERAYDVGRLPGNETQIYTWKNATLKEIAYLIGKAYTPARNKGVTCSFNLMFYSVAENRIVSRPLGVISYTKRSAADFMTLEAAKFVIGDYLDISIQQPPVSSAPSSMFASRGEFGRPYDSGRSYRGRDLPPRNDDRDRDGSRRWDHAGYDRRDRSDRFR